MQPATPTVEQAPGGQTRKKTGGDAKDRNDDRRTGEDGDKEQDGYDPDAGASDAGVVDPGPGTTTPPPTTEPPPPSNFTEGSGGPKGAGQATSSSGLQYRYDVPQDNQAGVKGHGLLVLLHGSGASNYQNFVGMMSDVANQYGLIRVSVLAPNGSGWNEGGEQSAADKLHQLVQNDLYPRYNIDKSKIFFSGQSSGAGFLSSHFVAMHADKYRGGAFMQCGASTPRVQFSPNATTTANFKLHFEITTGDGIWTNSFGPAVQAYKNAGMQVTSDNTKSGGHCSFDQQQIIANRIGSML